jgi:hypothetical protein
MSSDEKSCSLEVDDLIPEKGKGLVILLYGKAFSVTLLTVISRSEH